MKVEPLCSAANPLTFYPKLYTEPDQPQKNDARDSGQQLQLQVQKSAFGTLRKSNLSCHGVFIAAPGVLKLSSEKIKSQKENKWRQKKNKQNRNLE